MPKKGSRSSKHRLSRDKNKNINIQKTYDYDDSQFMKKPIKKVQRTKEIGKKIVIKKTYDDDDSQFMTDLTTVKYK